MSHVTLSNCQVPGPGCDHVSNGHTLPLLRQLSVNTDESEWVHGFSEFEGLHKTMLGWETSNKHQPYNAISRDTHLVYRITTVIFS